VTVTEDGTLIQLWEPKDLGTLRVEIEPLKLKKRDLLQGKKMKCNPLQRNDNSLRCY
jgi:hypothetical protein